MKLFIKNMVCARCERTVERLFEALGLSLKNRRLGEVEVEGELSAAQMEAVRQALHSEGFELLDDRTSRLISEVKNLVVQEIHHDAGQKPETMNFSDFLS